MQGKAAQGRRQPRMMFEKFNERIGALRLDNATPHSTAHGCHRPALPRFAWQCDPKTRCDEGVRLTRLISVESAGSLMDTSATPTSRFVTSQLSWGSSPEAHHDRTGSFTT